MEGRSPDLGSEARARRAARPAARSALHKVRLLDLIRNFIIFDAGQKKVPRPHQYFGMKAAQERVQRAKAA
jgi:type I site-specific restriction-modification system R (restriction) subunit